jgi:hypothetical protein
MDDRRDSRFSIRQFAKQRPVSGRADPSLTR